MKKKIAILIAGWHFPKLFYKQVSDLVVPDGYEFDIFVVTHRDIELPVVYDEKVKVLTRIPTNDNHIGRFDHALYYERLSKKYVESLKFKIVDEENKHGDYYYINQWLRRYDYNDYEYVCYSHDDNFITNNNLVSDIVTNDCKLYHHDNSISNNSNWLMIYNTNANGTTTPRGSFAFFKKQFFKEVISEFDMSNVGLDRTGIINSDHRIGDWNSIARNLNRIIEEKNIRHRILKLSAHYRLSDYLIEGERGFLSKVFM